MQVASQVAELVPTSTCGSATSNAQEPALPDVARTGRGVVPVLLTRGFPRAGAAQDAVARVRARTGSPVAMAGWLIARGSSRRRRAGDRASKQNRPDLSAAQIVLLSARGMDVTRIATVTFTSADRVRDVLHNFTPQRVRLAGPEVRRQAAAEVTLPQRQEITKTQEAVTGTPGQGLSPVIAS